MSDWLDDLIEKDVARPVWVTKAPWAIDKTMQRQRKALELLFGERLVIINNYGLFIAYTPGEICHCRACSKELQRVIDTSVDATLADILSGPMNRMILCPDCGNKRCPQSAHHDNQCTKSNEPGQTGSYQ